MVATLTNNQVRYAGKKILLYRPLPAMDAFHRSRAKNRWLFGGNRSGKSESNIGFDLCSFALGIHPHRRTPKNATIWAAANTWELAELARTAVRPEGTRTLNLRIDSPNGAFVSPYAEMVNEGQKRSYEIRRRSAEDQA